MKEPVVIDLIHPHPLQWHGVLKDWDHSGRYGKKPVIKRRALKIAQILGWGSTFPYELKEDKHILKFDGGEAPVYVLKPTTDIPNYTDQDFENSAWNRMNPEESQRVQQLQQDLEDTETQMKKYRRKLRRKGLLEDEEQDKGRKQSKTMLKCTNANCGETRGQSAWEDNGDLCPECDNCTIEEAREV